jgi:hypothetical protein
MGFVRVAAPAARPGADAGGDDMPACEQAHAWQVDDQEPPVGDQVAHFLVPTARMWDDVVFTCSNQRIFLLRDLRDRVARSVRTPARLRHGPTNPVATRLRLVRRPARARLRPTRAKRRCGLLAQCRPLRRVLGSRTRVIDGALHRRWLETHALCRISARSWRPSVSSRRSGQPGSRLAGDGPGSG